MMKNRMSRIMVVEDKTGQREELMDELTDAGYEVSGAGNASQAQVIFASFRPDLIIMDIHMGKPGAIDGVSIAARLRETGYPFALVFLTGYDYDYKDTKHVSPEDFLQKSQVLDIGMLKTRLEIAWDNYLRKQKVELHIEDRKTMVNGIFVLLKEKIGKDRNFNQDQLTVAVQSCKEHIKTSDILLVNRVQGANKKQIRLFMQDGSVYRVSKNLTPFLKYLNQKYLIQINGSTAINARMVQNINIDGEDISVDIMGLRRKFKDYFSLPLDDYDNLKFSSFFITRTYKEKGVVDEISGFE